MHYQHHSKPNVVSIPHMMVPTGSVGCKTPNLCRGYYIQHLFNHLLPTGSEERGVLRVGSIPVAILPSCQDMKTFAL